MCSLNVANRGQGADEFGAGTSARSAVDSGVFHGILWTTAPGLFSDARNTLISDDTHWYRLKTEDCCRLVGGDLERGLGHAEASDRLFSFGANRLPESRRRGPAALLLSQFRNVMILILLAAALVAAAIGEPQDSVTIIVIVLLNAIVGAVQQYRAENAIAALRRMAAPSATVVREGHPRVIPAQELVPGDLVLLETGAVIPADLRLLTAVDLEVDESLLTGESRPVAKCVERLDRPGLMAAEQRNIGFRGTLVTRGRGRALVVATGRETRMGEIAGMLASAELLASPLQQRLARFGKRLSLLILAICALLFLSGLLRGEPPMLMLLTAISLAVAAIPEALPAVVSISLAIGAFRMIRINTLVRSLPSVETLGSVSVICSDKTGTLTENRMRLEKLICADGEHDGLESRSSPLWQRLGLALALNNDVRVSADGVAGGDPTEIALWQAAAAAGYRRETLERQWPRIDEIPFTSERQRMTSLHRGDAADLVFCKGAPEALLDRCSALQSHDGLQPFDIAHWQTHTRALTDRGYRVLAVTCREVEPGATPQKDALEQDLVLLGLVALMDPPRPEVRAAVAECRNAGIRPIMITGDHPGTALAIARRLGIASDDESVVTGAQLRDIEDSALPALVERSAVYARVSPGQKIRLVEALQGQGRFVAMTGDGVNDAPALRRADIGVAMGVGGTDVAREAADMVLLDDNFATIVAAVREGRRIFDNIRKFIRYTMTSNAGEVWTLALAPLLGMPLPLLPIHILWINLVTDGLPGLALTTQPAERGLMRRPPRPPQESLFAGGMWQHMLFVGLLIGGLSLAAQAWGLHRGVAAWQTMVFTVLTFCQLAHVMVIRNERDSLFSTGLAQNRALLGAVLMTVSLQFAVIYLPWFNVIFRTAPLALGELMVCLALPLVVVAVLETQKWRLRRREAATAGA